MCNSVGERPLGWFKLADSNVMYEQSCKRMQQHASMGMCLCMDTAVANLASECISQQAKVACLFFCMEVTTAEV